MLCFSKLLEIKTKMSQPIHISPCSPFVLCCRYFKDQKPELKQFVSYVPPDIYHDCLCTDSDWGNWSCSFTQFIPSHFSVFVNADPGLSILEETLWWNISSPKEIIGHDDVIKWKYFLCYWPFVQGIHQSPVNSPQRGQWHWALMFSLICTWTDNWVNSQDASDLRCHHTYYDVIVINGPLHLPRQWFCILETRNLFRIPTKLFWFSCWWKAILFDHCKRNLELSLPILFDIPHVQWNQNLQTINTWYLWCSIREEVCFC